MCERGRVFGGVGVLRVWDFCGGDAGALAQIYYDAFDDEIARGMPRLTPENFIERSKREGVKIFVAEDENGLIEGFLILTEGSVELPAQIHMVAVRKDVRGRGVGKGLVERALEH